MELKEMIKVMQHFDNGGDVECEEYGDNEWKVTSNPCWDWFDYNYRIKEPKQKVTIEKWLMQSTIDKEYRIVETSLVDTVVNFKKIKLVESYEVELWKLNY